MAHIVIFGASRGIGREAVDEALDRGHRVRAFARSAERIDVENEGLERMAGDARSPEDVQRALEGADAAVQALGVPAGPRLLTERTLFSDATRTLLAAMRHCGVHRLVAVTGYGAGDSQARMSVPIRVPFRLVLGRAYDDKSRQERMIRESELTWTIARPGMLTNGARTGTYRVLRDPEDFRYGAISRKDVAHFLIGQVEAPTEAREAPVLVS